MTSVIDVAKFLNISKVIFNYSCNYTVNVNVQTCQFLVAGIPLLFKPQATVCLQHSNCRQEQSKARKVYRVHSNHAVQVYRVHSNHAVQVYRVHSNHAVQVYVFEFTHRAHCSWKRIMRVII
jgi:hypothetical protein